MANTVFESGDGSGFAAKVASDGSVSTAVTNAIDTRPAQASITRTEVSVTVTGGALVGANSSRRQVQIQNLDPANSIHIRLDATTPTVKDLRIDPGQTYSFPPGAGYSGDIAAIAIGGTVPVIVVEFEE